MKEIKQEWARDIIGQAIAQVNTKGDIERVTNEIRGTAIGVNKAYMEAWKELIEIKQKAGMIK